MLVICNINTGTTLILKTIINELECNESVSSYINGTSLPIYNEPPITNPNPNSITNPNHCRVTE